MSDGYNFDFNEDLPAPSVVAAEAVTREQLEQLFEALWNANAKWNDGNMGARAATLGALEAVGAFLKASPYDGPGAFSRPIELLKLALEQSPKPYPGEILAPADRQQRMGREKRPAINYLKSAMVYAADQLHTIGVKLDSALIAAAEVGKAHGFPFTGARAVGEQLDDWRAQTHNGKGPVRFLESLQAASPIRSPIGVPMREEDVLSWLEREFQERGYELLAK